MELADKEFVDFEVAVDLNIEVVDFAAGLVVGTVVVFVVGIDSLAVVDTVVVFVVGVDSLAVVDTVVALVAER